MGGETDLDEILKHLQPSLISGDFVFCTIHHLDSHDVAALQPVATYHEEEGLSLVLHKGVADEAGLVYESVFSCISLKVYSSLEAVGLTAAVAGILAENNISANVIAAFHHDHVYVPKAKAALALQLIQQL